MTGEEFKTRRKALGLNQAEIAMRLGVHRVTVSDWERGAAPVPEMAALAIAGLEAEKSKGADG